MGQFRLLLFAFTLCFLAGIPLSDAIAAGPPSPRATAAAPEPTSAPPASPSKVSKPAPKPSGPDAEVERAIRARFSKSKISSNGFTVRMEGGTAILEGKTGIIQHKGTATRLAKLAGAKRVDNRIEISEEARQKAAAHLASGKRVHVQAGKAN